MWPRVEPDVFPSAITYSMLALCSAACKALRFASTALARGLRALTPPPRSSIDSNYVMALSVIARPGSGGLAECFSGVHTPGVKSRLQLLVVLAFRLLREFGILPSTVRRRIELAGICDCQDIRSPARNSLCSHSTCSFPDD
jgi:hypothetical protein